ncbi:glycosyltransferase [Alphaproteobacteria bacterium]|nr:glycosyltransferase [Alphaproteobacteria bacterium]
MCLQIIPTMGIGGVETGVRDISKFLKKSNIQNYILCEESNKNLKERDLDIVYLKNLKFKNIFDQIKIKNFISKLIDKRNINLVHISSRAPAFFLIKFLKKRNIRIVTSVHNRYKSGSFLKDWYNSFLTKGDEVIFNSNFVKNSYYFKSNKKKNYHVIPRGIDINYFKPLKKSINPTIKKIFLPSRISSWKGHETLLKYYKKLPLSYQNEFKLVFISSHLSPYEIKIDKHVEQLSLLNNVIFVKPTLDIKPHYNDCYLVINISTRPEGFGRTISEALSMSKPVLAPNQGGTKEQLSKFDKKLMFNINSHKSFYEAFKYAIKNYQSIKMNSRSFVKKNYSSDLMCQKTKDIYLNLIK